MITQLEQYVSNPLLPSFEYLDWFQHSFNKFDDTFNIYLDSEELLEKANTNLTFYPINRHSTLFNSHKFNVQVNSTKILENINFYENLGFNISTFYLNSSTEYDSESDLLKNKYFKLFPLLEAKEYSFLLKTKKNVQRPFVFSANYYVGQSAYSENG